MNDELKAVRNLGAELGAAKAENDRLREALRWYEEKVAECRKIGSLGDNARQALDLDGGFRARDALSKQAEPTDTYTAVEMATAAAQGFRDWHKAEPAPAQDEMVVYRAVNQFGSDCHFGIESLARVWAGAKGSVERVALKPVPELSLVESRPAQDERETFEQAFVIQEGVYWSEDHQSYLSMNGRAIEDRDAIDATMWWTGWKARAALARPAQTEQQPEQSGLIKALEYYANGNHLLLADPDAWDTCSGEPLNFLHDDAGTASVEDGSIARVALEAYRAAPIAQTEQQPAFLLEIGADGEYAVQVRDKDWLRSMRNKREHQTHNLYSAPIAQTAPQGKFRMGDLVKKSTGSEWVGRVVGWYSTEQTKEGYAVESSAHRNSVQIYPVTALEAVE